MLAMIWEISKVSKGNESLCDRLICLCIPRPSDAVENSRKKQEGLTSRWDLFVKCRSKAKNELSKSTWTTSTISSALFKFYFWLMKTIWNSKRENLVLKVNIVMDDRMWITIFWCSSQRLRTSKHSPNFVALRQFSHVTSVFDTGRGDHLHNYKHFNKWPVVSFFCWGQTG